MKNVSVVMSWVLVMGLGAALSMAAAIRPVGVQDWGAPHDPGDFFWITQTIDSSELDENENGQMDYLDSFAVIENQDLDLFAPELDAFVVYDLGEMATINNVTIRPRHPHGSPNGPRDVTIYSIPDLSAVSGTLDDLDDSAIVIAGDIEFNGISGSLPDLAPSDTQSFPEITTQYVGMKFTSGYDQNHGNVQFSDVIFDHAAPTLPFQDSIDYDDGPVAGKGSWAAEGPLVVSSEPDRGFDGSYLIPEVGKAWNFHDYAPLDSRVESGMLYFGVDSASTHDTGRADTLIRILDGEGDNVTAHALIAFRPSLAGNGIEPSIAWDGYEEHIDAGDWEQLSHDVAINLDDQTYVYTISNADGVLYETPDEMYSIDPGPGGGAITGVNGFRVWTWGTDPKGVVTTLDNWYANTTGVDPYSFGGGGSPADLDGDGDVDFTDFSTLAFNFTGTLDPGTGGYTAAEGDLDGDEDVDFTDFSRLAADFTGTLTAPASDDVASGDVRLSIDMENDGAMTLEASNASLAGYSIRSSDSQLVPDADGAAAPFMFYLLNAAQEVTAGSVGSATTLTSDLALDISFGGDADQAANVVFEYTRAGDVTPVAGVVNVIPEPASLILLAAGGLLVISRHRRSA